ncbi:agmatine coumaroyltransferase-2-like [Elaeis guineensis]|uniref:agmatine coumaroyltransferase-2-like n=1 Tax=Elaeis guineensis var. tenera TaxID=51953 RepID=UPI003C6D6F0F
MPSPIKILKVSVESTSIVKPKYAGNLPTTTPHVPLSVFDKVTYDMHIASIYAFRAPTPPNSVMQNGLTRVFSEYREFAGRLGEDAEGNPVILLNDEGVRFVEAGLVLTFVRPEHVKPIINLFNYFLCYNIIESYPCTPLGLGLSSSSTCPKTGPASRHQWIPLWTGRCHFKPSSALLSLHPEVHGVAELLGQVQLTRFACGSLVVGFTSHHRVADAHAASNFLIAWSLATRGLDVSLAVHDRCTFFTPRLPPLLEEFEHRGVEFAPKNQFAAEKADPLKDNIVVHKAHFTKEFLTKLKARASAGASKPYSTFESLMAHLWRVVTKARRLHESETTHVRISVNGRRRMNPRLPDEYFGNVVLWAYPPPPPAKVREVVDSPLRYAAELIRDAVARVNDAYFKSFIDLASSGVVDKEELVPTADADKWVLCPNVDVDGWLRLPSYDLDFGGGIFL